MRVIAAPRTSMDLISPAAGLARRGLSNTLSVWLVLQHAAAFLDDRARREFVSENGELFEKAMLSVCGYTGRRAGTCWVMTYRGQARQCRCLMSLTWCRVDALSTIGRFEADMAEVCVF